MFGGMDTGADIGGGMGGMSGMGGMGSGFSFGGPSGFGGQQAQAQQREMKPEVLQTPLKVSLEEMAAGFKKSLKVTKKIQDSTTRQISTVSNVLTVDGRPGIKAGTKYTFAGAGDELDGKPRQDIQFVLEQKPHSTFTRNGDDLETTVNIPLADALCGGTVHVPLIDGTKRALQVENVKADTVRIIHGQGMPSKAGKKGNLRVKFNVKYPHLNQLQKQEIRRILSQSS
jgi:DnaJ-class molecular chaperone